MMSKTSLTFAFISNGSTQVDIKVTGDSLHQEFSQIQNHLYIHKGSSNEAETNTNVVIKTAAMTKQPRCHESHLHCHDLVHQVLLRQGLLAYYLLLGY